MGEEGSPAGCEWWCAVYISVGGGRGQSYCFRGRGGGRVVLHWLQAVNGDVLCMFQGSVCLCVLGRGGMLIPEAV